MSHDVTFDVVGRDRGGKAALDRVGDSANKLHSHLRSAAKIMAGAAVAGTTAAGAGVIALGKTLFDTAIEAEQMGNKAKTVFGAQFPLAEAAAARLSTRLGMTQLQTQNLLGGFGDLLTPMGFTTAQAEKMSERMGTLTGALSLWSGGTKSAADVGDILQSALTGEYDSLKGLGVQIDADTIKTELHRQGKDKLTGAALKQASAQIALDQIYKQSSNALTAYNKHTNKLTEAKRTLDTSLAQIKERLAVQLTPAFIALAGIVQAKVVPAVTDLADKYGPKLADMLSRLAAGDTSKIGPQFHEVIKTLGDLGTAISTISVKVPDIASVLSVAALAFGFLAKHIDLVRKAIPFIIAGFAAYKAAQTAANLAALLTIPVKVFEIAVNRQLVRSNLELVAAQRANRVATLEGAAADQIGTVAKSGGILASLRSAAATVVQTVASKAAAVATKVWAAGQWLLNAALSANPIGLVIIAIIAIAAAVVLAYKKSDTFRAIVLALWAAAKVAFAGVVSAATSVWNWIRSHWPALKALLIAPFAAVIGPIIKNWGQITSFFSALPGKIGGYVSGVASRIISPFASAFNAIRSLWNSILGGFHFSVPSWVPGIGGNGFTVPFLAEGGIVTRPTLAVIGEAGPEAVVPLHRARGMGGIGGDGAVNVYVTSPLASPDQIARAVVSAMQTATRRGYRPPTGWTAA